MDSRTRFLAACAHQAPDRPPVDYLAHRDTDARLRKHLGVGSENELLDALKSDFYYLSCRDISQNETCAPFYKPGLVLEGAERTCPFGIRWRRSPWNQAGAGQRADGMNPTAKFTVDDAIRGPLSGVEDEAAILAHAWPKSGDFDFSALVGEAEAQRRRVLVGGLWTGIMGDAYRMVGFEHFLYLAAAEPRVVKTLVTRLTDVYLELNEAIFTLLKGRLDVWFFGNDFGSQQGLLLGRPMWRDFFFENLRRLCAHAHGHGLGVMMHSCGSIRAIIPDLIEAGVDILDPIQVSAKDMDPGELKRDFGSQLAFHGGIDTQEILPRGTPDAVAAHARQTAALLGGNGGYVFAPSQILQEDVPVENIMAMYGALGN